MDVSSTSATATAGSATVDKSASAQQTPQNSDASFKDEMNKVSAEKPSENKKTEQTALDKKNAEAKDAENLEDKSDENNVSQLSSTKLTVSKNANEFDNAELNNPLYAEINFNGMQIQNGINNINEMNTNADKTLVNANRELENITFVASCKKSIDYGTIQMSFDDAQFFTNLVQNTDKTLQHVAEQLQQGAEQNVQNIQQNVKVSATLMNALSESMKTNQPFRIDFDKDVSVIIKVERDGSLSAKFIPGDAAVEQYLKQNMQALKQRFDDENLAYRELSYSSQQQKRQRNNENNKENNRE